jgi:YD repeat-containing protein
MSLPSYNPNVTPLGLVYNSAAPDPQPVFLANYTLDPSESLPTTVTAQLSLTDAEDSTVFTGAVVTYDPSELAPGDTMVMALPLDTSGLTTGQYNWQIAVTANYTTPTTTNYTGSYDFVAGSTTPTSATATPFGAGWSLASLSALTPQANGVILQNPDGTSLWFANGSTGGTFVSPAGDFSSLTLSDGVYTRTLPDGTQFHFNSSGQETSSVDRDGNTTSITYNDAGQLTTVTDMNGQENTITYNTAGLATAITDPAGRSLTLSYNGAQQLTGITDPDGHTWQYGYTTADQLTTLSDPRSSGTTYTTSFSYNSAGQVSGVTQPDGSTESFTAQQSFGLAASGSGTSSSPAPATLAASAVSSYVDGNGHTWVSYLDGLGFGTPIEQIDPLGDTTLTYRDANDLAWLSSDPLGRSTRSFFDSMGNTTEIVYPDGTYGTATYNSFAEPTEVTNLKRLTGGLGGGGIGGSSATSYLSYDMEGNLTAFGDSQPI